MCIRDSSRSRTPLPRSPSADTAQRPASRAPFSFRTISRFPECSLSRLSVGLSFCSAARRAKPFGSSAVAVFSHFFGDLRFAFSFGRGEILSAISSDFFESAVPFARQLRPSRLRALPFAIAVSYRRDDRMRIVRDRGSARLSDFSSRCLRRPPALVAPLPR